MSSPKRIAYLVSQYPAVNHTYILREIRELRKLGWEIEVASISSDTRPVSNLTTEEREELSGTYYIKAQGIRRALWAHLACLTKQSGAYLRGVLTAILIGGVDARNTFRYLLYFTEALIVGQWMQTRQLKHAHIHYASTVGLLLTKTFPLTISITIHGPAEFADPTGFHLREKIEASRFVCAISAYGRKQLMKACSSDQWDKLTTIPLGIDPDKFKPGSARPHDSANFTVISVARLSPEKGHSFLIDAVARLLQEGRQLHLHLIGEGPDRLKIEKYVAARGLSDSVQLEGGANQDQLRILYRNCDAFVLASLAEGLPVVLMEAMSMEIPCVATRITGIPELIQHGVDGLLVAPADPEELATALARLMDEPDLRSRLGKAARRKVIQKYNLLQNTTELARVLGERTSDPALSQSVDI